MEIHNAIMNINISITDIYNCIMGTHIHIEIIAFSAITRSAIMDIHDWIMDIHIWIMDVHNSILNIYDSWILWIAISKLWIFMIDCIYIRRSFICFWISIVSMPSYFQPFFSMALHHASHDITALMRHNRFHKIYIIAGPRGWKRDVLFSSRFHMNCHNISLWFTNHNYKTGQPCYYKAWAYFASRYNMQWNLKQD